MDVTRPPVRTGGRSPVRRSAEHPPDSDRTGWNAQAAEVVAADIVIAPADSVRVSFTKAGDMAQATVKVLIDDLDGSDAADTVRIGWNGDWRELDLSKKNLTSLSRLLDKYWNAARPVSTSAGARRRNGAKSTARARKPTASRDPKLIRAWAIDNGIAVPARGRLPGEVEQQYNDAHKRK